MKYSTLQLVEMSKTRSQLRLNLTVNHLKLLLVDPQVQVLVLTLLPQSRQTNLAPPQTHNLLLKKYINQFVQNSQLLPYGFTMVYQQKSVDWVYLYCMRLKKGLLARKLHQIFGQQLTNWPCYCTTAWSRVRVEAIDRSHQTESYFYPRTLPEVCWTHCTYAR